MVVPLNSTPKLPLHPAQSSLHVENVNVVPHQGHEGAITVPNAHLLFSGDFEKSGADLIISDREHRVVVSDYFRGEKRPALISPEGAPLDPKVIEALSGHTAYAQAGTAPAAKVVGHVVKMTGSASLVRNGVTIELNNGDAVYQTDVVQTGSSSSLGLVLVDGTTFNLSANARLMLNDLTYDPTSTSNTSLYTLVQGAASFVAGQVAKTGDMKVGTPVATVGVRGTAVILDISAIDGKVSISVVDQDDGQVHSVQVFDSAGSLIGTVTSNGSTLTLTPTANFNVVAQQSNGKDPALVQQEFSVFQQLLTTYDAGKQLFPNLPAPSDGKRGDVNPQSTTKFAEGSTPIVPLNTPTPTFDTSGLSTKVAVTGTIVPVQVIVPAAATTGSASTSTTTAAAQVIVVSAPTPSVPIPFVVTPSPIALISTGNANYFGPVMSADGNFVTYDPDGAIFLYDRQTNTTITIASPANGFTFSAPTISADGHFIAFQGTNGTSSFVYLYDNNPSDPNYQQTTQLAGGSSAAISGNGSEIVVENGGGSIVLYDQQAHVLATITPATVGFSGSVWKPAISADGHLIAFWASNSVAAGGAGELFTYNVSSGTVSAIASAATGAGTSAASLSADGHYIVFQSDAPDLFGSPGTHPTEIFLYDLSSGHVIFSTAAAAGASYNPVISPDGHFIVFSSTAQLTSIQTNGVAETYVVNVTDPSHPVYELVSASVDGAAGNSASDLGASISAGGLFVAFGSSASNFNTSGTAGIFVVDPNSGNSAIIDESASSPSQLQASGVVQLTGDTTGTTLSVSDQSGKFSAIIGTDGNIHWTFQEPRSDFAALTPGQVSIQNFTITLSSGVTTTTIPVEVSVYDADQPSVVVAPVVTITSAAVTTNQATQTVAGMVDAADVKTTVTLYDTVNGVTTQIGTATVGSGGTWSTPVTLSGDGSHSIVAKDTDAAGYTGTSAPVVITLATVAPTIAITPVDGNNLINNGEAAAGITISGTAMVGSAAVNGQIATITIVDSSNTVRDTYTAVVTAGSWSVNVTAAQAQGLADGSYSVQAGVSDAAGNAAPTATQAITVAETLPTVTIALVDGNDAINNAQAHASGGVALSGTVSGLAQGATFSVSVTDGTFSKTYTATVGTGGNWTATIPSADAVTLANGTATVSAQVTDAHGNQSTLVSQSVTVAETLPTVTIALVDGNNLINASEAAAGVALSGTVSGLAGNSTFQVTVADGSFNKSYTATVNGAGTAWTATIPSADAVTLANGTATVSAQVTDAHGNQ